MLQKINDDIFISNFDDKLKLKPINNHSIYLVQQFFIHNDSQRYKEIKYCLKENIKLNLFEKIILLNEKIYSKEELGLNDNEMNKIIQINIIHRLKYNHVFLEIQKLNINGYIVLANSDIFFDKTITNVRKSCLSLCKSFYSLLRFEYKGEKKLGYCKLFVFGEKYPNAGKERYDSQDTWIYHTSQIIINKQLIEKCNILLGKPGCDNKITYNLFSLGYKSINSPWNVKSYHNHRTQIRNYTIIDVIEKPYLFLLPNK